MYFSPKAAEIECIAMLNKAKSSKITCAFCLLVVFGSQIDSKDRKQLDLFDTGLGKLYKGERVARVLRIPFDDVFSISSTFIEVTSSMRDHMSEVYASQSFLDGHSGETDFTLTPQNVLLHLFVMFNRETGMRMSSKQNDFWKRSDLFQEGNHNLCMHCHGALLQCQHCLGFVVTT